MAFTELEEIRKIRKKLDLTQAQLSKRAGVSQSLIAKLESGRLDPGYTKTKQIFDALDDLTRKQEKKAGEIMNKKIITARADEKAIDIIKKMKRYAISQIPVVDSIDHSKLIGLITEGTILSRISSGKEITHCSASEIMEECPPIITQATSLSAISQLLRYFPIVMVAEKGALKGLISKADFIEKIA